MNKKIKEIIEALEFMCKTGDVSKIALESLKNGLEELDEQLNLSGVVSTFVLFAEWLQYNGKWSLPEQQVKDFFKEQQEQN